MEGADLLWRPLKGKAERKKKNREESKTFSFSLLEAVSHVGFFLSEDDSSLLFFLHLL